MRRPLILLALAALLATPAFAAEEKKADDANGNYVDVSAVGLPVVLDGRLVNYVFTQVRLMVRPGSNTVTLREKEPYFRDALVKAGHRTPFSIPGDPNKLDEAALQRVMAVEAAKIAGPGVVVAVQVVNQQPKKFVPK